MAFPSYEAWAAANGQAPTPQMRNDAQTAGKPYTYSNGTYSGGIPASTYQSAWEAKQTPSNSAISQLSPYSGQNAGKRFDANGIPEGMAGYNPNTTLDHSRLNSGVTTTGDAPTMMNNIGNGVIDQSTSAFLGNLGMNVQPGNYGGLGGLGGLGGMQQPNYAGMMQQQQQMYQQMMQQQQQAMQAQNQSMRDMMSNWSKGFGAQQGGTYNPTGVGGSFSNVQSPVYRSDGTMDGGRAPRNGFGGLYGGDGPFRSTF